MNLLQVQIHNLRNIQLAKLDLHPKINLFLGGNGSGKTSILEAIYLLGRGRSFRNRETLPLINYEAETLTIFASTSNEQNISIQKTNNSLSKIKLNGISCQNSSDLAYFLPCQLFYQDIFAILEAQAAVRRSTLDWGLFYMYPDYHTTWKQYSRALQQRNALLKQQVSTYSLREWNKICCELAFEINHIRENYLAILIPQFNIVLRSLTNINCELQYYKGWGKHKSDQSLAQILEENYASDLARQYTQYGPHQADLLFTTANFKAKQNLSRGQQKMVLLALKLAQAQIFAKPCIYLCDDLAAELDACHIERLLTLIEHMEGQFFMTAIHDCLLPTHLLSAVKIFTLMQGQIHAT